MCATCGETMRPVTASVNEHRDAPQLFLEKRLFDTNVKNVPIFWFVEICYEMLIRIQ